MTDLIETHSVGLRTLQAIRQLAIDDLDSKVTIAKTTIRRLEAEKATQATKLSDITRELKRRKDEVSKLNKTVATQQKLTPAGQNKEIEKLKKELDEMRMNLDVQTREVTDLEGQLAETKKGKKGKKAANYDLGEWREQHEYKEKADVINPVLVKVAVEVRKAFMLRYLEKKTGGKMPANDVKIVETASARVYGLDGEVDFALFNGGSIRVVEYDVWEGRFEEIYGVGVVQWRELSEREKEEHMQRARSRLDTKEDNATVGGSDGGGHEEDGSGRPWFGGDGNTGGGGTGGGWSGHAPTGDQALEDENTGQW